MTLIPIKIPIKGNDSFPGLLLVRGFYTEESPYDPTVQWLPALSPAMRR